MKARASRAAVLMVAGLAGGCLSPSSVTCSDGRICPAGTSCGTATQGCVTAGQRAACEGLAEGAGCTVAGGAGQCTAGVCQLFRCGDGVRNGGESCDGSDVGNETCLDLGFTEEPGLRCKADCTFDTSGCRGFCGDGIRNGVEACDGADLGGTTCLSLRFYSQSSPLTCNSDCTFNATGCYGICGDKVVNGPEQCDTVGATVNCIQEGFDYGFATCSTSCQNSFDECVKIGDWQAASVSQSTFTGVWGSGPDDVYAVADSTLAHWNGSVWSLTDRAIGGSEIETFAVWGSGPSDVFVAGASGGDPAVFHWDGSQWETQRQPGASYNPNRIWGSGPRDIYALCTFGEGLFHGDGTNWTKLLDGVYENVGGSGPDDVYLVTSTNGLVHWDGAQWSDVAEVQGVAAIWADQPDDVFAVGAAGKIQHFDGTSWSTMNSGTTRDLVAVWGSNADDVFAVGDSIIDHWDGTTWTPEIVQGTLLDAVWNGAWAAFAVGTLIERRDASRWGKLAFAGNPPILRSVWSDAPDDVFAVGDGGALSHWNGSSWTTTVLDATAAMRAVWGNGPDDVLAVGDASSSGTPMLAHWNGTAWSPLADAPPLPMGTNLAAVWSSSISDVYVGGQTLGRSVIFHWNGSAWSDLNSLLFPDSATDGPPVTGIWGSGPRDVFVFGGNELVAHWDGAAWSGGATAFVTPIAGVWDSGAGPVSSVVVATDGGAVWASSSTAYLWAPSAQADAAIPTRATIHAVGGSGAGDVFLVGDDVLLHRRLNVWQEIALPGAGSIYGLWVTPSRVTMVGTMGELHLDRTSITCAGPERDCNDGWDNDCDGLVDAEDPDCLGAVPENCANGIDDDGDGHVDCADSDCSNAPYCGGKPPNVSPTK